MILPHPESDLSNNLMVLGADILSYLKGEKELILIEHLMETFLKAPKRTPEMFMNTLVFLYSCGFLEHKDYKIRLANYAH